MSAIRLSDSPQTPSIEVREHAISTLDRGENWQQRMMEADPWGAAFLAEDRRRREENAAQFMRPRQTARLPALPDLDALLAEARRAVVAAQASQRELDAAEEAVARAAEDYNTATALLRELSEHEAQHINALAAAKHAWYAGGCVGSKPEIAPAADVSAGRAERAAAEAELEASERVLRELGNERDRVREAADRAVTARNAAAKRVLGGEAGLKAIAYLELIAKAAVLHEELSTIAMVPLPEEPGRPASPLPFDPVTIDVVTNPRHAAFTRDVAPQTMVARAQAIAAAVHTRFRELVSDPPAIEAGAAE